jgi:hypothetical protein
MQRDIIQNQRHTLKGYHIMKKTSLGFFLLLMVACSPEIQVHTDFDPDYDLWTFKTFDWGQKVNIEEGRNPFHYNELNDKRIKSAVQDQLTKRGYLQTDTAPELTLHYHIIVKDKSVFVTESYDYSYSAYWMRMETNIYSYREGTLILDLMDSKTNNLIWRGWAVSPLDSSYKPEEIDKLIKKAVAKIFNKFPKTRNQISATTEVVSN